MLGRRYQLERELGRGASGAVYRGRDLRNGRLIAVKILRAGPCEEPGFLVTPYAHARGAVHGDLSPSNIVDHRASDAVKMIDAADSPLAHSTRVR